METGLTGKLCPNAERLYIIPELIKAGVTVAWNNIGKELRQDLINEMFLPKTGRIYRIGGALHQASNYAPMETPAWLSGNYAGNIKWNVKGWGTFTFGVDVPYANFLEHGSPQGRIKPRKGIMRSIKNNQDMWRDDFDLAILEQI